MNEALPANDPFLSVKSSIKMPHGSDRELFEDEVVTIHRYGISCKSLREVSCSGPVCVRAQIYPNYVFAATVQVDLEELSCKASYAVFNLKEEEG